MFAAGDGTELLPWGNPPPRRQGDRFFGVAVDIKMTGWWKTEGQEESIQPGDPGIFKRGDGFEVWALKDEWNLLSTQKGAQTLQTGRAAQIPQFPSIAALQKGLNSILKCRRRP